MASDYQFVGSSSLNASFNQGTLEWQNSSSHRRQVFNLLAADADPTGDKSIAVWGAGHCNDIEIKQMLTLFRKVHLVDLDSSALAAGVQAQGVVGDDRVVLHGDVDLAGFASSLPPGGQPLSAAVTNEIQQRIENHRLPQLGQYDVVVSTCMLSQLMLPLVRIASNDTDLLMRWLPAVRTKHLELMLQHTKPGGAAILVTDVTSSTGMPELLDASVSLESMYRQVCSGNHFHGLNPAVLQNVIAEDPTLAKLIASWQQATPWRWNATTRWYFCMAYRMVRKSE